MHVKLYAAYHSGTIQWPSSRLLYGEASAMLPPFLFRALGLYRAGLVDPEPRIPLIHVVDHQVLRYQLLLLSSSNSSLMLLSTDSSLANVSDNPKYPPRRAETPYPSRVVRGTASSTSSSARRRQSPQTSFTSEESHEERTRGLMHVKHTNR